MKKKELVCFLDVLSFQEVRFFFYSALDIVVDNKVLRKLVSFTLPLVIFASLVTYLRNEGEWKKKIGVANKKKATIRVRAM